MKFYRQITFLFFFWCNYLGKKLCWISRNISTGYDISISVPKIRDMDTYLVISNDLGYDITIHRDMSFDITPDHLETRGKHKFNENPPPRCRLLLFFLLCLCLVLACPPSGLFSRPSVVHQLDTHHRTDRSTSEQQPCPLRTRSVP